MTEQTTEAWVEQAYNDILEEGFVYDDTRLDPDALNDENVDFLLNKMAGWENEKGRRKAAYEKEVRRLDGMIRWFNMKYAAKMEVYLRNKLAGDKKRKSIGLPCGVKLAFRAVKETVQFPNQAAFIAWARDNDPELHKYEEKITESVDLEFLLAKKAKGLLVTNEDGALINVETGEVLPGAAWRPAGDSFSIQFPKTATKKGAAPDVDEDADLLQ